MRRVILLSLLASSSVMAGPGHPPPPPARAAPVAVWRATLTEDNKPAAACGTLKIWTILRFDVSNAKDLPSGSDPKQLPIAVPCAELSRPAFGAGAGDAGVLAKGRTYVISVGARGYGDWSQTTAAWPAERIDDAK